jgi:hypothetical protein
MDELTTEQSAPVQENSVATKEKMLGGITGKGWLPGQSGNPGGRFRYKPITEIYERMLKEGKTGEEIEAAMRRAIRSRGRGSQAIAALKELADRVEGKPTERVEHSGPDGEPLEITVTLVD